VSTAIVAHRERRSPRQAPQRAPREPHAAFAVRDGTILRVPGQEAVWLFVNTANEHIR